MKPVKNISKSFFEVGGYYEVGTTALQIRSIYACWDRECPGVKCYKTIIQDMSGASWCGVEEDFRKISGLKYRRFMNEAH